MNEDVLNTSIRKYLKEVGVTSQREIEKAIRNAIESGTLTGGENLPVSMVLTIAPLGLAHKVDGTIKLQ